MGDDGAEKLHERRERRSEVDLYGWLHLVLRVGLGCFMCHCSGMLDAELGSPYNETGFSIYITPPNWLVAIGAPALAFTAWRSRREILQCWHRIPPKYRRHAPTAVIGFIAAVVLAQVCEPRSRCQFTSLDGIARLCRNPEGTSATSVDLCAAFLPRTHHLKRTAPLNSSGGSPSRWEGRRGAPFFLSRKRGWGGVGVSRKSHGLCITSQAHTLPA